MRAALVLGLALSSGCSVLDRAAPNGQRTLDPTKIYLSGQAMISVRKHDIDDYACINGPMICESHGIDYQCRCSAIR